MSAKPRLTRQTGFTLAGMLLITALVAMVLILNIRFMEQRTEQQTFEKVASNIQQIASAGLAYYVKNGQWPGTEWQIYPLNAGNTSPLQPDYLNTSGMFGPTGVPYQHEWDSLSSFPGSTSPTYDNYFWIFANVGSGTDPRSLSIQKRLRSLYPLMEAYSNGNVWVAIPPPSQNVSNATGFNFAGLFHHGGCVPVPSCPRDARNIDMTPQIFVTPVSVSGVNDVNSAGTGSSSSVYPISSFTAYATSMSSGLSPPPACNDADAIRRACGTNDDDSQRYWRACLQVITQRGDVATTNTIMHSETSSNDSWGQFGTIAAFTRCSSVSEETGSDFTVYTH